MKKILLANNQESFLDRNKTLLNRAGFTIFTATSSDEAMKVCREERVNLIIIQLDLPGCGGVELAKLIRQDRDLKNVSIILVCYETEVGFASRCGANAVITKPVRPDHLLQLVVRFLRIRERRDYRASFEARIHGSREAIPFSGVTRNISASGMLCETQASLNPNDLLIELNFAVGSNEILTSGKVVWSAAGQGKMQRYGVQFMDLDPELRDKIENFIMTNDAAA